MPRTSKDTSADVVRKQVSSLKAVRTQSVQFLVERTRHQCNQIRRYTDVRDKCHNDRLEYKYRSLNQVTRLMLDTCVKARWWIVDNEESSAATTSQIIAWSYRSTMVSGQPLPFWFWYLPLFTHICQHRLVFSSLWPKCQAIVRFV